MHHGEEKIEIVKEPSQEAQSETRIARADDRLCPHLSVVEQVSIKDQSKSYGKEQQEFVHDAARHRRGKEKERRVDMQGVLRRTRPHRAKSEPITLVSHPGLLLVHLPGALVPPDGTVPVELLKIPYRSNWPRG
jgi:hypothetical protein